MWPGGRARGDDADARQLQTQQPGHVGAEQGGVRLGDPRPELAAVVFAHELFVVLTRKTTPTVFHSAFKNNLQARGLESKETCILLPRGPVAAETTLESLKIETS